MTSNRWETLAAMISGDSHLLDFAPGPTPWYLAAGIREISSNRGTLTWHDRDLKKVLCAPDGTPLAVVPTHCWLSRLGDRRLLAWTATEAVNFRVIDVDLLAPIPDLNSALSEIASKSSRWLMIGGEIATFAIPADLSEGRHRWEFPEELRGLDELLVLLSGRKPTTLWIMRPKEAVVDVYPQDWFNRGNYDFGYQWPTRVVRDPESGDILGDGIRMSLFVLDSSYRRLASPATIRKWAYRE